MDQFARATATRAHKASTEAVQLAQKALELARLNNKKSAKMIRMGGHHGRCSLCGAPCKPTKRYCAEHDWAA